MTFYSKTLNQTRFSNTRISNKKKFQHSTEVNSERRSFRRETVLTRLLQLLSQVESMLSEIREFELLFSFRMKRFCSNPKVIEMILRHLSNSWLMFRYKASSMISPMSKTSKSLEIVSSIQITSADSRLTTLSVVKSHLFPTKINFIFSPSLSRPMVSYQRLTLSNEFFTNRKYSNLFQR